jgi:hypothetical protein
MQFDHQGKTVQIFQEEVVILTPNEEDTTKHDVVVKHAPRNYTQWCGVSSYKEVL